MLLFLSNREGPNVLASIAVIATDITTGVSYRHSSVEKLQKSLGMPKGGYMKKAYLDQKTMVILICRTWQLPFLAGFPIINNACTINAIHIHWPFGYYCEPYRVML